MWAPRGSTFQETRGASVTFLSQEQVWRVGRPVRRLVWLELREPDRGGDVDRG